MHRKTGQMIPRGLAGPRGGFLTVRTLRICDFCLLKPFRNEKTAKKSRAAPRLAMLFCLTAALLPPSILHASGLFSEATPPANVNLQLENADIVAVLNAFSIQTGKSLVIGPEVSGIVNVRLNNIPWEQALDVILKPYGFGYTALGETIVVNPLETIAAQQTTETLETKVFKLRYLDASDVEPFVTPQLSERGQLEVLTARGPAGWEFASSDNSGSRAAGSAGKRVRESADDPEILKSKLFMVKDIQSVIESIQTILDEVDVMPKQILIEAKFVEVNSDFLRDVGLQFGTGPNATTNPEIQTWTAQTENNELYGFGVKQSNGGVTPSAFNAQSLAVASAQPFNAGMSFVFQRLSSAQYEIMVNALEEDDTANILSAPRIVTLNNQEAGIIVGTKFPIISSDTSGQNATVSTTLEYYENIGIQLNVIPQVCDDEYISMIVHPAVTDQIGVAAARTGTDGNIPLTEYPVLSTREAETQILLRNNHTVVIGGLLADQDEGTVVKVPFLGDIPLIGRAFKRKTANRDKLELLIFLTARIISEDDFEPARPNLMGPHPVIESALSNSILSSTEDQLPLKRTSSGLLKSQPTAIQPSTTPAPVLVTPIPPAPPRPRVRKTVPAIDVAPPIQPQLGPPVMNKTSTMAQQKLQRHISELEETLKLVNQRIALREKATYPTLGEAYREPTDSQRLTLLEK